MEAKFIFKIDENNGEIEVQFQGPDITLEQSTSLVSAAASFIAQETMVSLKCDCGKCQQNFSKMFMINLIDGINQGINDGLMIKIAKKNAIN